MDAKAPGEKIDIRQESLYDYLQHDNGELGLRVSHFTENGTPKARRTSTAHITSGGRLSNALLNNQNARFAYDQLVTTCVEFLASPVINDTVTQFAENILTLIESPTTLDTPEVKRRIEQVLPSSHEYKHHRGMTITDKDCTRLCSLADRVVNNAPYTNLNIVDDEVTDDGKRGGHSHNHDVHYIRQIPSSENHSLPKQLPSFVESNLELDGNKEEYDMDVTPYDSDIDEPTRIET